MENVDSPSKAGLNTGLILGLISVVLTFLIYFIDSGLLVTWYIGIGMLVLYIGLIIYFGMQYRNSIGGYMSFGSAFNFAFITLVVSGIITVLGNILLYTVVDPALPKVLADAQMESQMALLDRFGAGESFSSEQIDEMRTGIESAYTPLGQLKGFGFLLIGYAIIALIIGAVLKKRDKSLEF
jgi:hypothetical protein